MIIITVMENIRLFIELKVNVNLLLVYFFGSSPPLSESKLTSILVEFKCEDYCLKVKTNTQKILKLYDDSLCLIPS